MQNKRVPIFSFAQKTLLPDFIFFIVVVVSYAIIVGKHELTKGRESSVETLIAIVSHVSPFMPVAMFLTFIFEIGGSIVMILWNLYKKRQEAMIEQVVAETVAEAVTEAVAKARAEARAEALAQANREWTTWYNRMMEAQAKGLPFDEPPPVNLQEPTE